MRRLLFSLLLLPVLTHAQIITTIAGNGMEGSAGDGGAATNAKLVLPIAVSVDHAGNVYISTQDDLIRKVNTSGIITTIAGNAGSGYNGDGIPATDAKLDGPGRIAFDDSGNIYIPEGYSNRVRKIDAHGIITTVAGNGTVGYAGDGGTATTAELNTPVAVAVDDNGSIIIADANNNRIRKIDAHGIITTIVGDGTAGDSGDGGPATAAEIFVPSDLAIDHSDGGSGLFFVDNGNNRVRHVNSAGTISVFAGGGIGGLGNGGPATAAKFLGITGVAVDHSGNVYIVDEPNSSVRIVNASGIITTFAGNYTDGFSGDDGPATIAQLNKPYGIAVDDTGNIYIDDLANNRIRKVSKETTKVNSVSAEKEIIDIYPNPAINELIITSSAPITDIVIFNVLGQSVTEMTRLQNTSNKLRINIDSLAAGIYFLRINNSKVSKFVKY